MRHLVNKAKLGRTKSHRDAMLKNMLASLFIHEKIETTLAKAKFLQSTAEKLITRAKSDSVHNRRIARKYVEDKDALVKLFNEIGPRHKDRNGGYTRIVKTGFRKGDNAPMAIIEILK
ncbi:MAG: 50S ribosomal protein L17 [Spirochaetes bacterium]|nr:50S ribosomal protein L17 [Spirochaetota bacterium]MBP8990812.1 50S ribosomal protein L17 [Spirochaetota bacterium]NLJ05822.1 50S ribosomal protein L17 [Exilispira sp.]HOV45613.1 50S ribosomal protein L17 [Exilispira sp.]HPO61420.1 50S ribosomal protein L17 [Exilispira sp.]